MRTYTLSADETLTETASARIAVDEILAEGRAETAPILPIAVRLVTRGPRGAEWVRAVADYQEDESVGYASLEELLMHHELPPDLDLEWETSSRPFFAAVDRGNTSGAVYGVGSTPEEAIADAARAARGGEFRAVPCSATAAAYVQEHGGAPDAKLTVTARGVWLRSEGEG